MSQLLVVWDDGLESFFDAGWLFNKCISSWRHSPPQAPAAAGIEWGFELSERVPAFNFRE